MSKGKKDDAATGPVLTRAQLLADEAFPAARVLVQPWGGVVIVRGLSAAGAAAWEESYKGAEREENGSITGVPGLDMMTSLVCLCVVDENGDLLLTKDDAEAMSKKSAKSLQTVFEAALKVSGLAASAIEDAEKN